MSLQTVEIEAFSGPTSVLIGGGNQPTIVYINQGPTGAAGINTWGSITGTLSSQTDLQTALDLKANLASPIFTGTVTAPHVEGKATGLELYAKAGQSIAAGQAVYVTGASGANIIIGLAKADVEATSSKTIGINVSTLANNAFGYVVTEGRLTVSISKPTGIVEGDPIWLSPTTAGGLLFGLANKPSAPYHQVYLGVITRINGNTIVELNVHVQNGFELTELSDVDITTPLEGQALMRGATLWENRYLVSTDITDAASAATIDTIVLRNHLGDSSFNTVNAVDVSATNVSASNLNLYDQILDEFAEGGVAGGSFSIGTTAGSIELNINRSINFSNSIGSTYSYSFPSWATGTIALSNQSQTFTADQTFNQIVSLSNPEQSTSFSSGALRMTGGAYITKNLNVGGILATVASTTTTANLKLPHGAAPTSPVNGDVWTTTAGSFVQINGTTRQTATLSNNQSFSGNQTFAGTAAFTNTARPTAVNVTGTAGATDLINRNDGDARYKTIAEFPVTSTPSAISTAVNGIGIGSYTGPTYVVGYAAGTTAGSQYGIIIQTPSIVETGKSYTYFPETGNGTIIDFSIPWSVYFKLILARSTAEDDILRIAVGELFAGGLTVPAFGCNGFGIRLNKKSGSTTIYQARVIGKVRAGYESNFITGATNASPIQITCSSHGLANGDFVEVVNVGGNTAANGIFEVAGVTSTTFNLVGSTGNGAFTSNGAFSKISSTAVEITAGQAYDIQLRNTVSGSTYGCELSIGGTVVLSITGINRLHNNLNVRSGACMRAAINNVSSPLASFAYMVANIRFVQPV